MIGRGIGRGTLWDDKDSRKNTGVNLSTLQCSSNIDDVRGTSGTVTLPKNVLLGVMPSSPGAGARSMLLKNVPSLV